MAPTPGNEAAPAGVGDWAEKIDPQFADEAAGGLTGGAGANGNNAATDCANGESAAWGAGEGAEKNELSSEDDPTPGTDCTTGPLNMDGIEGTASAEGEADAGAKGGENGENGGAPPGSGAFCTDSGAKEKGLDAVVAGAVMKGLIGFT